jgi:hypothetical protein
MVVPRADPAPGVEPARAPAGDAEAQFLDADGRPVGRRRRVHVPLPPLLEGPAGGGTIGHEVAAPLLEIFTRLPAGAVGFRLEEPGRDPIEASIRASASPRPTRPKSRRRFGPAGARFTLAVLAERYEDEARFHADCAGLLAAIEGTAPFDETPGRVAVEALFWKTDPAAGQLGPLQFGTGTDLMFGDRRLAAAFLKKARVRADRALVLVNLRRRGGAGGTAEFPAWVANESSPTDRWESVAIHELGHALGLGDEYDSANPDAAGDIEPNISAHPDPARAPWATLCTAFSPIPTASFGGGGGLPAGTIGTFQGARYDRTRFFRAQFACLMRSTRDPFCARCRELIRDRLA